MPVPSILALDLIPIIRAVNLSLHTTALKRLNKSSSSYDSLFKPNDTFQHHHAYTPSMMLSPATLFFTTLLPLLTTSTPINALTSRAGGPNAVPIPANCTTINPLPHANCGTANVDGFAPNVSSSSFIYSSYYEGTGTQASQASFCFEQCNGFDGCVSAVFAQQVPTPAGYYGTPGGQLMSGCLFYDVYLDPYSFEAAPTGEYVNATAINIYCPQ